MSDPDFDSGFDQGKRVVRKTTGWVAGVGTSVFAPLAKAVGSAGEAAQKRRQLKQQHDEVRHLAFEQQSASLQQQVLRERERREPLRLRYVLFMLALGGLFAYAANQSISPSPDRWKGILVLFVFGVAFGAMITSLIRSRHVRRAQRELRRHLHS
jgi:hypothetical protein